MNTIRRHVPADVSRDDADERRCMADHIEEVYERKERVNYGDIF